MPSSSRTVALHVRHITFDNTSIKGFRLPAWKAAESDCQMWCFENGATPINSSNPRMSSIDFWMGVPVTAQRWIAVGKCMYCKIVERCVGKTMISVFLTLFDEN